MFFVDINMQMYIRYIIIATYSILLYGCSDYFAPESDSTYTSDLVFSNEDLASQAVTGIYASMCDDYLYSKKLSLYCSMNTDIEAISGEDDNGRRAIARYEATPSNSEIYGIWKSLYSAIEHANNCIYGIRNSKLLINGNEQQKAAMHKLLGESLCLRALLYFDLVKNWGDVPFHTEPTINSTQIALPATDRHLILETLISDLKDAENWLPWSNELGTNEKISKGFAKGLRARIALFCGGVSTDPNTNVQMRLDNYLDFYKIADTECKEIIDAGKHSLNPSFKNIFQNQCTYQKDLNYYEPMFELAFGRLDKGELGYYIGVKHEENALYGKSEAGMLAPPSYFYSFNKHDTRRDVTCAYHAYNLKAQQELTSITTITLAKWRKEWIKPTITGGAKYTGINFTFMRYPDVLLMYAEAENELNNGPTEGARNALKSVRQRAFPDSDRMVMVTNYVDSITGKEAFFNAIVQERAWEFGGECLRKYDLIRWGLLDQTLASCKSNLLLMQERQSPYSDIPQKIYWKIGADGESIEVANIDSNFIPEGFDLSQAQSSKWSTKLTSSFIEKMYEGDVSIHEFLPIPQQAISDSNGLLKNHYNY